MVSLWRVEDKIELRTYTHTRTHVWQWYFTEWALGHCCTWIFIITNNFQSCFSTLDAQIWTQPWICNTNLKLLFWLYICIYVYMNERQQRVVCAIFMQILKQYTYTTDHQTNPKPYPYSNASSFNSMSDFFFLILCVVCMFVFLYGRGIEVWKSEL